MAERRRSIKWPRCLSFGSGQWACVCVCSHEYLSACWMYEFHAVTFHFSRWCRAVPCRATYSPMEFNFFAEFQVLCDNIIQFFDDDDVRCARTQIHCIVFTSRNVIKSTTKVTAVCPIAKPKAVELSSLHTQFHRGDMHDEVANFMQKYATSISDITCTEWVAFQINSLLTVCGTPSVGS